MPSGLLEDTWGSTAARYLRIGMAWCMCFARDGGLPTGSNCHHCQHMAALGAYDPRCAGLMTAALYDATHKESRCARDSLQIGLPDVDGHIVLCCKLEQLLECLCICLCADAGHAVVDPVQPQMFIEGKQLLHALPGF